MYWWPHRAIQAELWRAVSTECPVSECSFSTRRGLSAKQRHQFTSLGDNVIPIEVLGTFDDCQRLVKEAFVDQDLRRKLNITSANSINICRLLPQMFYYFYAYSQLLSGQPDRIDSDGVVFSVPCGNLGNLTAGLPPERWDFR